MSAFVKRSAVLREVSSKFGVSARSVGRWLDEGRLGLKPLRLGPKSILYRRNEVKKVIAKLNEEAA